MQKHQQNPFVVLPLIYAIENVVKIKRSILLPVRTVRIMLEHVFIFTAIFMVHQRKKKFQVIVVDSTKNRLFL